MQGLRRLLHCQKARDGLVPEAGAAGLRRAGLAGAAPDEPFSTPLKERQDDLLEAKKKQRSVLYSFALRCVSRLLQDEDDGDQPEVGQFGMGAFDMGQASGKKESLANDQLLGYLRMTQGEVHQQMKAGC